ncbi:MAG: DUF4129 domain-containing protein [Actinobacteria bacterium]|nr:DUF4129 domain-containing protein [Actinomycetota bacterium]MBA3561616.1 DUF4129 domain-containing protein [Actinomycetota bacterium]MBA3565881.1 DUF4129 domain-containing protein [Actinomycetota bacterium]
MRGSSARALLPGIVVLALLGVVAVAATGSTQAGSGETRRPSDIVLDTFFSFALIALLPAAALLVYGLMQRRAIAEEIASGKYRRSGMLVSFTVLTAAFALIWYLRPRHLNGVFARNEEETLRPELLEPKPERPDPSGTYEPEVAWIPILVVAALVATAIGAYVVAARRRARAFDPGQSRLAETVADLLDESLDDLRAEPDARRAVIAAYARLEQTFAASGLARLRHETAEEHVSRILGQLEVDNRLVRRLTELFARAKFSHHVVDETMKEEAIAALAQIRDELRAAARQRMEERMRVLAERAATS